jgi:hypothetical protein
MRRMFERGLEALREARLRLTEYAALMNTPAGQTGLTTHEVLWGDFCRDKLPEGVPTQALSFRFTHPLEIDRFKLSELKAAGRAIDLQAAAMGAMGEPAQPWRGVGNLNLTRFDRAKAVEAVVEWASTLRRLHTMVEEFVATSCWSKLTSLGQIELAVNLARDIPQPASAIEPFVLALSLDDSSRQSLSIWADMSLRAHELESRVKAVCSPVALDVCGMVEELARLANTIGVLNVPSEELPRVRDDAYRTAEDTANKAILLKRAMAIAKCDANSVVAFLRSSEMKSFSRMPSGGEFSAFVATL